MGETGQELKGTSQDRVTLGRAMQGLMILSRLVPLSLFCLSSLRKQFMFDHGKSSGFFTTGICNDGKTYLKLSKRTSQAGLSALNVELVLIK